MCSYVSMRLSRSLGTSRGSIKKAFYEHHSLCKQQDTGYQRKTATQRGRTGRSFIRITGWTVSKPSTFRMVDLEIRKQATRHGSCNIFSAYAHPARMCNSDMAIDRGLILFWIMGKPPEHFHEYAGRWC